jgi:Cryptococcal mannosyltransferase 1
MLFRFKHFVISCVFVTAICVVNYYLSHPVELLVTPNDLNDFLPPIKDIPTFVEVDKGWADRPCAMPEPFAKYLNERYLPLYQKQHSKNAQRYFIALNLYNVEKLMPTMIELFKSLANFLGTDNVFISVYENGSDDNVN